MNYLKNHITCHEDINGEIYNCKYLITIEEFLDEEFVVDKINKDKDFIKDMDWYNNIIEKEFFNKQRFEFIKELRKNQGKNEIDKVSEYNDVTYILKPEIIKWLNENIKNGKDKDKTKGWNIGSDLYNSKNSCSFNIFFYRYIDAMKFVKEFSVYKKPLNYLNYFDDIRKQYNIKSKKLEVIKY